MQFTIAGLYISLGPNVMVEIVGLGSLNIAFGLITSFSGLAYLISPPLHGAYSNVEWNMFHCKGKVHS